MRAFYLVAFLAAFDFLREAYDLALSGRHLEPLWPVAWADSMGLESAAQLIGFLLLISTFVALWSPGLRWPRIFVFVSFLEYTALTNSFGSINHHAHYFIWISLLMIFFPKGDPPRHRAALSEHFKFVHSIFVIQCFISLFYTLSGLHKFYRGIQWSEGHVSAFHPDALPLLIVGRWGLTGETPMLSEFFVNYSWIAWPAFLLIIYVELTFLIAVFRPQLHKFYGFALASFHTGVWLTMGITFAYQPVLVALLFIWSPLVYFDRATLRERAAQLPIVDVIVGMVRLASRHNRRLDKSSQT